MKEVESDQHLTHLEDIYSALYALQRSRSIITLRFGHDANAFSSLLIHTDLQKQQFVIDEVRPEDGNPRLKRGEPFTLIAFYDGVQVMIKDCRITSSQVPDFDQAYAINFPKSLYHKQRRQVFRAAVARSSSSSIELHSENRMDKFYGRVVDISPLGIGCEFEGYIEPKLERGELFDQGRLNINNEFALDAALIVKHPAYNKITDTTQCGFEFSALDPVNQKALDRFILHLQRQARRGITRKPLKF
jgi:c-di-GMP-binding flagellar brake protein YcgR